jgi:hypothetical protein|tara:strand:+ start:847 stop:1074 length:228 start_codon:yes stop_codon:yes gene_type:complete
MNKAQELQWLLEDLTVERQDASALAIDHTMLSIQKGLVDKALLADIGKLFGFTGRFAKLILQVAKDKLQGKPFKK